MNRLLMVLAVFAIAFSAYADAPQLTLIAPSAGDVLEGGRETTLTWTAVSLPDKVEEWEAFLSLDGGHYYGARITPHLDRGIRSFQWRVPNVATSNARILIRIGNERDEQPVEFSQTFTIAPRCCLDLAELTLAATDEAAESALPAAPPVVQWVSGDRRGRGLVTRRHHQHDAVARHQTLECAASVAEQNSDDASLHLPRVRFTSILPKSYPVARDAEPPRSCPVLLLTTRLNI